MLWYLADFTEQRYRFCLLRQVAPEGSGSYIGFCSHPTCVRAAGLESDLGRGRERRPAAASPRSLFSCLLSSILGLSFGFGLLWKPGHAHSFLAVWARPVPPATSAFFTFRVALSVVWSVFDLGESWPLWGEDLHQLLLLKHNLSWVLRSL